MALHILIEYNREECTLYPIAASHSNTVGVLVLKLLEEYPKAFVPDDLLQLYELILPSFVLVCHLSSSQTMPVTNQYLVIRTIGKNPTT